MKKRILIAALAALLVIGLLVSNGQASGLFDFSFRKNDTVTLSRQEYEQMQATIAALQEQVNALQQSALYQKYGTMEEILQNLEWYYIEEPDQQKLLDYAVKGMMLGLDDPYSVYYTPEEWAQYWKDDEGKYVGIGIELLGNTETATVTVIRVFRGGPAERAGVRRGDILVRVEDIDVNVFTMQDAVNVMRGIEGEEVEIEVLRGGEKIPMRMKRASITVNRIEYAMLPDNVGYIALHEFAGESEKEFIEAWQDLKTKGARSLVIDLRENGGGWVRSAVDIADLFLDEGILVYAMNRDGEKDEADFATTAGKDDVPLVILINGGSASSSEILAGGLQDLGRATVVGTQSFGKGIIQVVMELPKQGGGYSMTYQQYFVPSGKKVHKVGITPDILSEMPEELASTYFELGDLNDPQLKDAWNAAKDLVK